MIHAMRVAGIDEGDSEDARDFADAEAVSAALRFAEKRRLGPFADRELSDPRERQKALAAMVRAGHRFELARSILNLKPGSEVGAINLCER